MKVWLAPYQLQAAVPSIGKGDFPPGYLMRVEHPHGHFGYACLQAWPTLGEPDVHQEIAWLQESQPSRKMRWLLYLALQEGEQRYLARSRGEGRDSDPVAGNAIWHNFNYSPLHHRLCRNLRELAITLAKDQEKWRGGRWHVVGPLEGGPQSFLALQREFQQEYCDDVWDGGVQTLKVKLNTEWHEFFSLITRLPIEQRLQYSWRFDFNGQLNADDYQSFCEAALRHNLRVDYIEDPLPWCAEDWRKLAECTPFALARDVWAGLMDSVAHADAAPKVASLAQLTAEAIVEEFAVAGSAADAAWENCDFLKVLVIKPLVLPHTLWPIRQMTNQLRWVFTSNLDHPLGNMLGLWWALRFYAAQGMSPEVCGFASYRQFAPTPYHQEMSWWGSRLVATQGQGVGFTDLLESEPWQEI